MQLSRLIRTIVAVPIVVAMVGQPVIAIGLAPCAEGQPQGDTPGRSQSCCAAVHRESAVESCCLPGDCHCGESATGEDAPKRAMCFCRSSQPLPAVPPHDRTIIDVWQPAGRLNSVDAWLPPDFGNSSAAGHPERDLSRAAAPGMRILYCRWLT